MSLPERITILDASGNGISAAFSSNDIAGEQVTSDHVLTFRIPLGEAELVGPPADWTAVNRLSFTRASGSLGTGTLHVHSVEVRKLSFPDCRTYNVTGQQSMLLLDDDVVGLTGDDLFPPSTAVVPVSRVAHPAPSRVSSWSTSVGVEWRTVAAAESSMVAGGATTSSNVQVGPRLVVETSAAVAAVLHGVSLQPSFVWTAGTSSLHGNGAAVQSVCIGGDGQNAMVAAVVDTGASGDDIGIVDNEGRSLTTLGVGNNDIAVFSASMIDGTVAWVTTLGTSGVDTVTTIVSGGKQTSAVAGSMAGGAAPKFVNGSKDTLSATLSTSFGFVALIDEASGQVESSLIIGNPKESGAEASVLDVAFSESGDTLFLIASCTSPTACYIGADGIPLPGNTTSVAAVSATNTSDVYWVSYVPIGAGSMAHIQGGSFGLVVAGSHVGEQFKFSNDASRYAYESFVDTLAVDSDYVMQLDTTNGVPKMIALVARNSTVTDLTPYSCRVTASGLIGQSGTFSIHTVELGTSLGAHSFMQWSEQLEVEASSDTNSMLLQLDMCEASPTFSLELFSMADTAGSITAASTTPSGDTVFAGTGYGVAVGDGVAMDTGSARQGFVGVWNPFPYSQGTVTPLSGFSAGMNDTTTIVSGVALHEGVLVQVGTSMEASNTTGLVVVQNPATGHVSSVTIDIANSTRANGTRLVGVSPAVTDTMDVFVAAGSFWPPSAQSHIIVAGQSMKMHSSVSSASWVEPLVFGFSTRPAAGAPFTVQWLANLHSDGVEGADVHAVVPSHNRTAVWVAWGSSGKAYDGDTLLSDNPENVHVGLVSLLSVEDGSVLHHAMFGGDTGSDTWVVSLATVPSSTALAVLGYGSGSSSMVMPDSELLVETSDGWTTGFVALYDTVSMKTLWASAIGGSENSVIHPVDIVLTPGWVGVCGTVRTKATVPQVVFASDMKVSSTLRFAFSGGFSLEDGTPSWLKSEGEGTATGCAAAGVGMLVSHTAYDSEDTDGGGSGGGMEEEEDDGAKTVLVMRNTTDGSKLEHGTPFSNVTLAAAEGSVMKQSDAPPSRRLSEQLDMSTAQGESKYVVVSAVSYDAPSNQFLIAAQMSKSSLLAETDCETAPCERDHVWTSPHRFEHSTVTLALDANVTGAVAETRGQFSASGDEWGDAYGFGVSAGTQSIVSCGFFSGAVSFGGITLNGLSSMDSDAVDGYVTSSRCACLLERTS